MSAGFCCDDNLWYFYYNVEAEFQVYKKKMGVCVDLRSASAGMWLLIGWNHFPLPAQQSLSCMYRCSIR